MTETGQSPAIEEIAKQMGLSVDRVKNIIEIASRSHAMSLETPVGDEDSQLVDFISDENAITAEAAVIQRNLAEKLQPMLADLPSREAEVLRRRFGMGEHTGCTLQELADDFGVSRERIRQVQVKGIAKMKASMWSIRSDFTGE